VQGMQEGIEARGILARHKADQWFAQQMGDGHPQQVGGRVGILNHASAMRHQIGIRAIANKL
jgi:hypothetical protein